MAVEQVRGRRTSWLRPLDRINLLAIVVGVVAASFILTGALAVLLLLPLVTALGTEGVLRGHPAGRLRSPAVAATQVQLPVTLAVAGALFFRYLASGYWGVLAAVALAMVFGAVAYAEYASVGGDQTAMSPARPVLQAAALAGLFALLSVFYAFDLALPASAGLACIAGALCTVELFRWSGLELADLALYSLVTGVVLAQLRWALDFVRLDGLLAALLLVVAVYVLTGSATAALGRKFDRRVVTEYALVGLAGVACVIAGRLLVGR